MDNIIGENLKIYENVSLMSVDIGNDVILGEDSVIKDCTIGNKCSIERRNMLFNSIIGAYTYTGYNTVIKYACIGKFCSVSWNVSIGGADHEIKRLTSHPFPFLSKFGFTENTEKYNSFDTPLKIGNDVWIGSNACILRGVTIGDGAVIGAGAVVTHDVGPYEIWAGIPAKNIGKRFSDNMIEGLLKLSWWDLPDEFISEHMDCFKFELTFDVLNRLIDLSASLHNAEANKNVK